MGVYGYALQIYCDFSGYSDMAIGIALLFFMHRQCNAVKCAPKNKIPGSSMPQPSQKHGNNKVQILPDLPFPVSTQRSG